jgi:hypothetical protein
VSVVRIHPMPFLKPLPVGKGYDTIRAFFLGHAYLSPRGHLVCSLI